MFLAPHKIIYWTAVKCSQSNLLVIFNISQCAAVTKSKVKERDVNISPETAVIRKQQTNSSMIPFQCVVCIVPLHTVQSFYFSDPNTDSQIISYEGLKIKT